MFFLQKLYLKFKKNAIIILVIIIQCFFIINTSQAATSVLSNITGSNAGSYKTTAVKAGFTNDTTASKSDIVATIGTYVQYFLSMMGVVFLVLMIYGGYIWMKAKGNESEATKAKGILMDSAFGVIIVFSAYVISNFIISSLAQTAAQ